ncbi:MAG: NAD(+) diphosphatase [Propionibacteriaceae bacterium]|nr:NAD(+) diphosphatase [Propionibacteriaceae bacterium]
MTIWIAPSPLDKSEEHRADDAWVQARWEEAHALVLAVDPAGLVAWRGEKLDFVRPWGDFSPSEHLLLGLVDQRPYFAIAADLADVGVPLRSVMDQLGSADLQIAFAAVGLVGWHSESGFCPRCGSGTAPRLAGQARECRGCQRELYPRVDPAVIVAVQDSEDRLLLGRQRVWEPGRMSVFAGFVEVGESLEQAVHREVAEEVGLVLEELRYLGSQPWPFPRSFMVAFVARTGDPNVTLDPTEIEEARWFNRAELRAAVAAREVSLPPTTSIARRMIQAWQSGHLTPGSHVLA